MKKLVVLAALFLAACGEGPAGEGGAGNLPVDTLSVALSIGAEIGDSTTTFGLIQDALILPGDRGEILVLDRQGACIKVFDREGVYIRQVSRRGSGPGEMGMPWEFFTMPDGRLMVLEMMKQGFLVLNDSLNLVAEISNWPQNPPMLSTALSDSTFASYKIDADMVDDMLIMNRRIVIYSVGAEDFDTILWEDSITAAPSDLVENPSMFVTELLDAFCMGGDGTGSVFFAEKSGEEYLVLGWNALGEEIFRAGLDILPVAKTPEEIEEEKTYMNNFFRAIGGSMPFEFEPEPYRNMVVALGIGPDGRLWVQRGTTDTPFFDIFDLDGELAGHAVFPEEGWSWTFTISPQGILAWEADPAEGYQRLFVLE
jgi:hypothetical protein